jgi:hypothetical protein
MGPIMWDIDGQDWSFWRQGKDPQSCASAYIDLIKQSGKGIILMHDSSWDDDIRTNSRTYLVAQIVVDWLQTNGYQFVRLDSIPQVLQAARVGSVIALQTSESVFHKGYCVHCLMG